jgi:hypothetical protein
MATFIQGLSDSFNDTPRPGLDYNILASQQAQANQLYQQKVAEIQNDYSAAVNLSVLGTDAEQLKQQYIKQAQVQLRDVAKQDLLMPANAAQAEQIFAPFWSDDRLLLNSGFTKYGTNNINKIKNGLMSKNEEERGLYDYIQIEDQQGLLEEVERAGIDPEKLRKIRKREIVPVRNVFQALQEAAAAQEMTVKQDSENGFYLVSREGGRQSVPNWTTFAQGVLSDPSWRPQFEMYARVETDRQRKNILSTNPNLTDQEVNNAIADNIINGVDRAYSDTRTNLAANLDELEAHYAELKANKTKVENGQVVPLANAVNEIQETLNAINLVKSQLKYHDDKVITDWNKTKQSNREVIAAYPEQYLYPVFQKKAIDSFVAAASAKEIVTIGENKGYIASVTAQRELRNLQRLIEQDAETARSNRANEQLTARRDAINAFDKIPSVAAKLYGDILGADVMQQMAQQESGMSPAPYTPDNTQLSQDPNLVSKYLDQISTGLNNIVTMTVGAGQGQLGSFLIGQNTPNGAVTTEDLSLVNAALVNKQNDPNYVYTSTEKAALQKIGTLTGATGTAENTTMKWLGVKDVNTTTVDEDPAVYLEKLKAYMSKQATGNTPKAAMINNILNKVEADKEDLIAQKKEIDDAVSRKISTDPRYSILNVRPEAAAPDFKTLVLKSPDGYEKILTKEEFAKRYLSGDIDVNIAGSLFSSPSVVIDGVDYSIAEVKDAFTDANNRPITVKEGTIGMSDFLRSFSSRIASQYNTPEENRKLKIAANKEVIGDVARLRDLDGQRGKSSTVVPGSATANRYILKTTTSLANPSNIQNIYNSKQELLDPETRKALFDLLLETDGTKENTLPKYVAGITAKTLGGPSSKPAVTITFKSFPENTNRVVGNTKLKNLLESGSVTIEVDPNTQVPGLRAVIADEYDFRYSDLQAGKVRQPYTGMKNEGFNVSIQPVIPAGSKTPSEYMLTGSFNVFNPVTGKWETQEVSQNGVPGVRLSANKFTPRQVDEERVKLFSEQQRKNLEAMRIFAQKTQNTPPLSEIEKANNYNK